ncbi:MAG: response regulator [Candidatus Zambryskibacteria bacterium]
MIKIGQEVHMRSACIFLVEDDPEVVFAVNRLLSHGSHEIVLWVSNLKDALAAIAGGRLEDRAVDVAIVDANFPEKAGEQSNISGGPIVAEAIRAASPHVKIIAFSDDPEETASYGDIHVNKVNSTNLLRKISVL